MARGVNEFASIQGSVPEWAVAAAVFLTQLGSVPFLAALLVALYVVSSRRRNEIALVGATWLAGVGVYGALKVYFALPRPDRTLDPDRAPELLEPAYETVLLVGGYGFPSGHAVNATIVYLGLASVLAVGPRLLRYAGAATLVASVALSRVFLGLHYFADVVAGVAVGIALLLLTRVLVARLLPLPVTATFGLAVGSSAGFVVASDGDPAALVLLSAALGAFAGWQLVALGRRLVVVDRPWGVVGPTVVRGSFLGAAVAPLAAALVFTGIASPYGDAAAAGVGSAAVVASPLLWRPDQAWRVAAALACYVAAGWLAVRHLLPAVGV